MLDETINIRRKKLPWKKFKETTVLTNLLIYQILSLLIPDHVVQGNEILVD